MKALLALTFLLGTGVARADVKWLDISARYTCQTNQVFLKTAEGEPLNFEPNTTVVYAPDDSQNQNLVIGNYGYVIWIRQMSDTAMGFTLMKNVDGDLKTGQDVVFDSNQASLEMDFPLNNSAGEGSAHCKIELSSKPSTRFPQIEFVVLKKKPRH